MADYPLTPIKLSTVDPALPTGDEDASRIDDVIRQTRHIFKELLAKIVDDDGNLKAVPIVGANVVTNSSIQDGAVSASKLLQTAGSEAVITSAIRDLAVTSAKLAALSVTDAKLESHATDDNHRAVGTNHIKDGAVTSAKIPAKGITATQLSNDSSNDLIRAVGTDHIKNGAVTEDKLAASVVTAAKMKSAGSNPRMYYDSGTVVTLPEVDTDGDVVPTIVASKIRFAFAPGKGDSFKNSVMIVERGGSNAAAGGCTAGAFNVRPQGAGGGSTDFVKVYDPSNLVSFVVDDVSGVNRKRILIKEGVYYVELSCAAYMAGTHFARLYNVTESSVLLETGPSITSANATDYTQDYTYGFGIITIGNNSGQPTKLQLEHYTTKTKTDDGLGTPVKYSVGTYPAMNNTYVFLYIVKLD